MSRTIGFRIAVVFALLFCLTGCNEDIISDDPFFCENDDQCVDGWSCNTELNECVEGTYTPDAGGDTGDTEDDVGNVEDISCASTGYSKPGTCPRGSFCLSRPVADPTCYRSECSTNEACGVSQKCLRFEDDFGVCIDQDTLGLGDPCESSGIGFDDRCNEETLCVFGKCARRCTAFSTASSGCPSDFSCLPFTAAEGFCVPDAETVTSSSCTPNEESGISMCADNEVCIPVGGSGVCLEMCPLGASGVCRENQVCDEYRLPGLTNVGVCSPNCNVVEAVCGADGECIDGKCVVEGTCEDNDDCDDGYECGTDGRCQ